MPGDNYKLKKIRQTNLLSKLLYPRFASGRSHIAALREIVVTAVVQGGGLVPLTRAPMQQVWQQTSSHRVACSTGSEISTRSPGTVMAAVRLPCAVSMS